MVALSFFAIKLFLSSVPSILEDSQHVEPGKLLALIGGELVIGVGFGREGEPIDVSTVFMLACHTFIHGQACGGGDVSR